MDQNVLTSRDIKGLISNGIEASKDNSWPFLVGYDLSSDQETEKYKVLGATPALREWIGGRSVKTLRAQGIDVINKLFEATIILALQDMRRDKTGFIRVRIQQLVDRYVQHWGKLLSTLREAGASTACMDGQYFYSASHAWGDSGTLSNLLTSSNYSTLAVTTAAAPTALELANAIISVVGHFFTLKDDQGEPLHENARRFLVQVPATMFAPLIKALSTDILNTGTSTVDNPLKGQKEFEIVPSINPRLTGTTSFYVDRIDGAEKPFILQNETGAEITSKSEGSDFEHDNHAHEYGINVSRNVGFAFWQSSIKATLSAAG
jgi:phage major head subunit gpT-like protein